MKSVEGETHIRRKTEYVRFAVPRTAGLLSTGGSSKYLFVLNKKAVFISYLIFFFLKPLIGKGKFLSETICKVGEVWSIPIEVLVGTGRNGKI